MKASSLTVAAIQLEQRSRAVADNMSRAMALLDSAISAGADLVVLPELFRTGYLFGSPDEARTYAELVDGDTFSEIRSHLTNVPTVVVFGYLELEPATQRLHNSAAVIDQDGLIANYRKVHPYIADTIWATDGVSLPPRFEVKEAKGTVVICADIEFPELFADDRHRPFELLCLPTAWVDERAPSASWWARAMEFNAYVIAADLNGIEEGVPFSGGSSIISPNGEIIASLDQGDGIVVATISLNTTTPDKQRPLYPLSVLTRSEFSFSKDELRTRVPRSFGVHSSNGYLLVTTNDIHEVVLETGDAKLQREINRVVSIDHNGDPPSAIFVSVPTCGCEKGHSLDHLSLVHQRLYDAYPGLEIIIVGSYCDRNGALHPLMVGHHHCETLVELDDRHLGYTKKHMAVAGLVSTDLIGWEACRAMALSGASAILVSGDAITQVPHRVRPKSQSPLPPIDGTSESDFHIGRLRAGENNVALALAVPFEGGINNAPSAIFGPDHVGLPPNEKILGKASYDVGAILIAPSQKLSWRALEYQGYLRRRKPWMYDVD